MWEQTKKSKKKPTGGKGGKTEFEDISAKIPDAKSALEKLEAAEREANRLNRQKQKKEEESSGCTCW
jgi:hypothetical protein